MKNQKYYIDLMDREFIDKLILPCCNKIKPCVYKYNNNNCIYLSTVFYNTIHIGYTESQSLLILVAIEELINTKSKKLALLNLNNIFVGIQIISRYILQINYCGCNLYAENKV